MDPILQFTYSVPNQVLPKMIKVDFLTINEVLVMLSEFFFGHPQKCGKSTLDFLFLSLDLKHCRVPIM